EGYADVLFREHLGLRLAESHHAAAAKRTASAPEEEEPDQRNDDDERDYVAQKPAEVVAGFHGLELGDAGKQALRSLFAGCLMLCKPELPLVAADFRREVLRLALRHVGVLALDLDDAPGFGDIDR